MAQLTLTAQTWELVGKPLRERGRSWFEIAADADWTTLEALARFAEQAIRLEETRTRLEVMRNEGPAPSNLPAILSNYRRAVDRRVAEIHPDDSVRTLFQEADSADAAADAAAGLVKHLEQVRDAGHVSPAMIFGMHHLHPQGLLPTEQPLTAEQLDQFHAIAQQRGTGAAGTLGSPGDAFDLVSTALPPAT